MSHKKYCPNAHTPSLNIKTTFEALGILVSAQTKVRKFEFLCISIDNTTIFKLKGRKKKDLGLGVSDCWKCRNSRILTGVGIPELRQLSKSWNNFVTSGSCHFCH